MSESRTGVHAVDVLLVDDDRASLELATEALADQASVRTARSLAGALAACEAQVPDCLVLDLGLPDADGVSAVTALTAAQPDVPLVVLTASDARLLGDQALAAGADDYVHKDALIARLPHAVHYAVGRARRRQLLVLTVRHAESVLRALPDAAVVRSTDGTIASANDAAVVLLGLEQVDGRWREPVGALHDEHGTPLAEHERPVRRVLRDGRAEHGRVLGVRTHGEQHWVEVDARPLTGAGGEVFAVVESFRDITAARAAQSRLRFQADLLEAVGQAVVATDLEGTVLSWNRAAEELYGWSAEHAVGRSLHALTPTAGTAEQSREIMIAVGAGLTWSGDVRVRRRDGSSFTALVTNRPLLDERGQPCGAIGVSVDVTARVEAEQAARRLAAVVDSTGDAVLLSSLEGEVLAWNRAAERLYGWTEQEALALHVRDLVPSEHATERAAVVDRVRSGETVREWETESLCKDGTVVAVTVTLSPVLAADGTVEGISSISRDATERRRWARALEHAALHDDLTGLPNRTLLADRLDQLVAAAARSSAPLAVLFVDLDAFKDVNDAHGHLLGDEVLREVATRLTGAVRPGDTVARFGGDEFVVLLPDTAAAEAEQVSHRLLQEVRRPMELHGLRLHVSVSIGLAATPEAEPGSLLRAADAAVYEAKARGRDQVSTFVGALSDRAQERLALSGDLHEALAADALHLVYQPVMDLVTGTVLGVEALVRWNHAERGAVPPATFVAVAEKTGLARALDDWVLRRACHEYAALRSAGVVPHRSHVAVNVTAASVVDASFATSVEQALRAAGLPPECLVLEVTETGVMSDLDAGVRVLTSLHERGVRIAIDDFGTGWSSLTYVRRLPASIIKLDRSFVARLHEDDDDLAIAASVIDLGRATGLSVVAEGVETQEQLTLLRKLGCAAGQGYLWHAGVPADALVDALARAMLVARLPLQATAREAPEPPVVDVAHGLERLWELHDEGASLASIAAALNRDGFRTPTGQRWHSRTVARVLATPALASSLSAPLPSAG